MMNDYMRSAFERGGSPWWEWASWLVPMLLVAILVGVAIWLVMRAKRPAVVAGPRAIVTNEPPAVDPAVEAARVRYARGEIGRDQFLRLSGDLGYRTTEPVPPAPSGPPELSEDDGGDR